MEEYWGVPSPLFFQIQRQDKSITKRDYNTRIIRVYTKIVLMGLGSVNLNNLFKVLNENRHRYHWGNWTPEHDDRAPLTELGILQTILSWTKQGRMEWLALATAQPHHRSLWAGMYLAGLWGWAQCHYPPWYLLSYSYNALLCKPTWPKWPLTTFMSPLM